MGCPASFGNPVELAHTEPLPTEPVRCIAVQPFSPVRTFLPAMMLRQLSIATIVLAGCGLSTLVQAQGSVVYRCPGNNFTNAITAKEAEARGCRVVEGGNVTVVESPKPPQSRPAQAPAAGNARPEARVDPAAQRARDADARRILEAELLREEAELAELRKEYNDGEPPRLGAERNNYQKYLDRVAEMKAAITRKENDIAAIRRELDKLPAPSVPSGTTAQ
jgi:hypothetical protein